ncbi:hypothetical protein D3C78_1740580 [compost metagenome]
MSLIREAGEVDQINLLIDLHSCSKDKKRIPERPLRESDCGTIDTPMPCDTNEATLSQCRASFLTLGRKPACEHRDSKVS